MKFFVLFSNQSVKTKLGSARHPAVYDFGLACPKCGAGAKRVNPIIFLSNSRFDAVAQSSDRDFIVGSTPAAELRNLGIHSMRPVVDSTRQELPIFELLPEQDLKARICSRSAGIIRERSCSACGRDGFFDDVHKPINPIYESPLPDRDILGMWEIFGKNSRLDAPFESTIQPVRLLVSERVKDVLVRFGAVCLPVTVGETPPAR